MSKHRKVRFSQRLNDFPPCLCRLLARHRYGPPLTTDEIMQRSNVAPGLKVQLNPVQVETFSQSTDWKCIHILEALAFMYGCRVDLTDAKEFRRINSYLSKKPTLSYLRSHKNWKSYYLPLIVKWRKGYPEKIPECLSPHVRKLLVRLTPIVAPPTNAKSINKP